MSQGGEGCVCVVCLACTCLGGCDTALGKRTAGGRAGRERLGEIECC